MNTYNIYITIFLTILLLCVIASIILIYFIPSIIAFYRKHPFRWIIMLINFCTGFTLIGWTAAFVWALLDPKDLSCNNTTKIQNNLPKENIASQLEKLVILRDNGDISQLEFSEIKHLLLQKYQNSN